MHQSSQIEKAIFYKDSGTVKSTHVIHNDNTNITREDDSMKNVFRPQHSGNTSIVTQRMNDQQKLLRVKNLSWKLGKKLSIN